MERIDKKAQLNKNDVQDEEEEEMQGIQTVQNEKKKRCNDFKKGLDGEIPLCFKQNSPKEELVLENVIEYKRQFQYQLYYEEEARRNRDLLLYPENECGVFKFICTTIRPTKLGFIQLYDYNICAQYLSQYITYEQLDPPEQFPSQIPSPTNVARWQRGDCFDISILLCSLLIGVGYDAYVVYGKAPRDITTRNETNMEYLWKDKGKLIEEKEEIIDHSKGNEFYVSKKNQIYSIYDKKEQEKKIQQEKNMLHKINYIDDDEPDQMKVDQYQGKRIHAWVLLKPGKREVPMPIFIEPNTGRMYDLKHSPYEVVDVIFNNNNYWINMAPEKDVKDVDFNNLNEDLEWEYVMLDTQQVKKQEDGDEDEANEDGQFRLNSQNSAELKLQELAQTLDMPPPWPPKIFVDKEKFSLGTLSGAGTQFYNKIKVDIYSEYNQLDGLVEKITIYEDYKKLRPIEYRYFYKHRSDKLHIRRRYPFQYKIVEDFLPSPYQDLEGKRMQWKQFIRETYVDKRDNNMLKQKNTINYYHNRNHDGLIKRVEIIGEKTMEYFSDRDDRLVYRSIRFTALKPNANFKEKFIDNHIGQCYIKKTCQKFTRDSTKKAEHQISKMVIDYVKQKFIVQYHMESREITPLIKIINHEQIQGLAKLADGSDKKDETITQHENNKLLDMEKECNQSLKVQESSAKLDNEFMRDEKNLTLEKTLQQKAREKFKETLKKTADDENKELEKNDYLYPYLLQRNLLGKEINAKQAKEIKEEVMKKLKDRLLQRAEIIQERLEEKRSLINQNHNEFNKKQEIDSTREKELNDLHFKIEILEQRALRFEHMALQKYEEMDKKLMNDPRLQELKNVK